MEDLKHQIEEAHGDGMRPSEIADLVGTSRSTVYRVSKGLRTGDGRPGPRATASFEDYIKARRSIERSRSPLTIVKAAKKHGVALRTLKRWLATGHPSEKSYNTRY